MLRIWRCDCALCVIGNEFPCRQPHNPIRHPLTRAIHFAPRIKTARRFTAKKPLMITWFLGKKPHQISQTILHGRDAILRVRDKLLISNMILQLWADVKYHVPTGFDFSPKAVFYVFVSVPPVFIHWPYFWISELICTFVVLVWDSLVLFRNTGWVVSSSMGHILCAAFAALGANH